MKHITLILALFMGMGVSAQEDSQKEDMAYMVVQSTTVCNMCKTTIEEEMPFVKGVHKATVNLETNEIGVDYNPKKTDKEKIKLAISKLGYQADDVPADQKAFAKLPACCQKEGCGQTPKKEGAEHHHDKDGEPHEGEHE